MWQNKIKEKKKKKGKKTQTDTTRFPLALGAGRQRWLLLWKSTGGQAPQHRRDGPRAPILAERRKKGRPAPTLFLHPHGLLEEGEVALLPSRRGLSFSQGLGVGAHSRKHILVSPGGQGTRERPCLRGQRTGERTGPGGTGTRRARNREEVDSDGARGMLASPAGHSTRCAASESPRAELCGFQMPVPQRGLDSLLHVLPAYSSQRRDGHRGPYKRAGMDRALLQPVPMERPGQEADSCLPCNGRPRKPGEEPSLGMGPSRERQDLGGERA